LAISHPLELQYATGVPKLLVSMLSEAFDMADGISLREKNHMDMPLLANSVTQTPPPALAKAEPYDLAAVSEMPQPEFELSW
jgi:hypothetical protein